MKLPKQFVVFEKSTKEILAVGKIDFVKNIILVYYKNGEYMNTKWLKFNDCVLLQYVGFPDSTGAKIYERNTIKETVDGQVTRVFIIESIQQVGYLLKTAPPNAMWQITGLNLEMEKHEVLSKSLLQS